MRNFNKVMSGEMHPNFESTTSRNTTGDQLNKTTNVGSDFRFGSGRDITTGYKGVMS